MRYLYEALVGDGYSARFGGLTNADGIIEDADIIVLPVNAFNLLKKCKNKKVIGGFTSEPKLPEGAVVKNYLFDKCYVVKNALATAEGAIFTAMQYSSDIILNRKMLITGFGNIGSILCVKLLAYGCDVTVCARSPLARANAQSLGASVCDFGALSLHPCDIIFNTVPHPVIDRSALLALKTDAMIIELASAPGGVDMSIANELGVTVVGAGGLPGKYCPAFSGRVLKDTVLELAEEV